ncbi:MAG TPA: DoxX family membrane protein, partial [Acidimicrobiales bacterium]|nr:DoxX family membrane protein [Acidimicrobiales bacterium]
MATATTGRRSATATVAAAVFPAGRPMPGVDAALLFVRVVLTWIFFYYGAGKLFGTFNGPGIHNTALYFSNTAHLHPGGF